MTAEVVRYTAPLQVWSSGHHGNFGFISVEGDAAARLSEHELVRRLELGRRRGFNSVKLDARVGESRWTTSAFPQKDGSWFLPVKKAICRAEGIDPGDPVAIELSLL